ncbi:MAG TPA: hypothetical protein VFC63_08655 [Blastocatellia bacterium]|nr:hypothetical protein [Blastocatellia bacterium]
MNWKEYNQQLSSLLSEEEGFATKLLQLSEEEVRRCESGDPVALNEITAQRREVLTAWTNAHTRTVALAKPSTDGSVDAELIQRIESLRQNIAAIQEYDSKSLGRLQEMTKTNLDQFRNVNQASRYLQSLNIEIPGVAYSSHE